MPIHVIAGHLVIVTAPITVLIALVYALRPAARTGMRIPLITAAAVNLALSVWAGLAGGTLYDGLKAMPAGAAHDAEFELAHAHAKAGDLLTTSALVLAVIVAALVFWRLAPRRPASGTGHTVAVAVLVLGALAVAWYTADTLGLAMQAVWSQHPIGAG